MIDKTNKISVNVVLDRSGSMNTTKLGTISGYNEYINALRHDKDSDYAVTLTQFDAPMASPELTVSYVNRALADVPELTEADYVPRGNTPLYDAIGECVRRVDAKDRAVIMLIITDGAENASTEFRKETVQALIKEKEAAGWTFAFLGANIDSYAVGGSVGVSAMNTANYVQGQERVMYFNLAQATMDRSASIRSVGAQSAVKMDFLNDKQRAEMAENSPSGMPGTTGGRHAAPPAFPADSQKPTPDGAPKRRDWTVKST